MYFLHFPTFDIMNTTLHYGILAVIELFEINSTSRVSKVKLPIQIFSKRYKTEC